MFLLSNKGKSRATFLLASSSWWREVLVFIQATQVQFLGRKLRSLVRTTHSCLSDKSMPDCFS